MIQLYTEDGLMVVGITRGNINKLLAAQPMVIRPVRPVKEILVLFGEDKPAIMEELKKAGVDVRPWMSEAVAADPS